MEYFYALVCEHFKLVDSQPIGRDQFFENREEKERYESYLNHSFRCLQAARYHSDSIQKHKVELIEWANERKASFSFPGKLKGEASVKMNKNVDHFAFELFAFVAALKSSVDFLLTATHYHLTNRKENCNTLDIVKIIDVIDRPKYDNKPLSAYVSESREWLLFLNEYRNCLLHRSSLILKSGVEYWEKDELNGTEVFPITIPIKPTSFILDTRELSAYTFSENHNLDKTVMSLEVTTPDGKKSVVEHKVEYKPSSFEIEIEEFIKQQLDAYHQFAEGYIRSIIF